MTSSVKIEAVNQPDVFWNNSSLKILEISKENIC